MTCREVLNMRKKTVTTVPKRSKETSRQAINRDPLYEGLTKNPPVSIREGPNNLRQREEWFRRRTGKA
jgi:hypothetical protein